MQITSINYKFAALLFTLLIGALMSSVYFNWQILLTASQLLQRQFHHDLTLFLMQISARPLQTGFLLTGLSLVYGIVHSAGPGHGKFIIATYLATQPKQFKRSLYLTLFSAIMQGFVAISLVTVLLVIFNLSTSQVNQSEYWLTFSSYFIVTIMGLVICYRSATKIIAMIKASRLNQKPVIFRIHARQERDKNKFAAQMTSTLINVPHAHNAACGCGHRHLPSATELNQKSSWTSDVVVILSIGMRPCSGAILVLLFSHMIGVYLWGIIATFAMSIGTAITTSCFALLVHFFRKSAEKLVQQQFNHRVYWMSFFTYFIAIIGGLLFVIVGALLITGLEMQSSAINPLFH